jgi:hypothetical protein
MRKKKILLIDKCFVAFDPAQMLGTDWSEAQSAQASPSFVEDATNWRPVKDRVKTLSVGLVLCLNLSVDPPDVHKVGSGQFYLSQVGKFQPDPCARLLCWQESVTTNNSKTVQQIGTSLQQQYERWQPRARYKQAVDPTVDDVKKLCTSLRRNARDERALYLNNGGMRKNLFLIYKNRNLKFSRFLSSYKFSCLSSVSLQRLRRADAHSEWGNLGFQQIVHAIYSTVPIRSTNMDGRAVGVRVGLQSRRPHRHQIQSVRREAH